MIYGITFHGGHADGNMLFFGKTLWIYTPNQQKPKDGVSLCSAESLKQYFSETLIIEFEELCLVLQLASVGVNKAAGSNKNQFSVGLYNLFKVRISGYM